MGLALCDCESAPTLHRHTGPIPEPAHVELVFDRVSQCYVTRPEPPPAVTKEVVDAWRETTRPATSAEAVAWQREVL